MNETTEKEEKKVEPPVEETGEPEKKEETAPVGETPEGAQKNKKEDKSAKKELQRLQKEYDAQSRELGKLKKDLENARQTENDQNERYLRMMAEYDNYRKRTAAEKDAIYTGALSDVFKKILPVVDALELALRYEDSDGEKIRKGVEMTLSKFREALEKLGVEEIETKTFDPNFHNAVMHVEDDQFGEGEILEVFQKGYKRGDKIIRYSMVKVAN